MKKLISLALCLALILGLAACGGSDFENAMTKAQAASAELKSMHVDMDMNISFTMSAEGQSVEMPVTMTMSMDTLTDPMTSDSTVSMNMYGMEFSSRSYIRQDGDKYTAYTSTDGGSTWSAQEVDVGDISQYDAAKSLDFYLGAAESFTLTGEEELDGVKALRYDGAITGDKLNEAMALTGADDMIASTSGTMPMTIWLDSESDLPLRYDLDMGEIMTGYMQQSLGETEGVTVDSVTATVSMRLSNFDGISELPAPEGVAGARPTPASKLRPAHRAGGC